jgi:predicted nucleic acid-binding protein
MRTLAARRVLVDTSAYFALADSRDAHHREARSVLGNLLAARYRQFTTNVLVVECHALILSALGIPQGLRFLQGIRASSTTVIRVRAQDEERAQQILARYTDKDFSLADAISFVTMERLGITHAFTFDHHFAQYGFTALTPDTVL